LIGFSPGSSISNMEFSYFFFFISVVCDPYAVNFPTTFYIMRFLLNAMQWRVDITGHAWRRYWTEPEDVFNSIGQRPRSYEDTLSNPQNGPGTEKRYAQESRRRFHAIVQDDMSVALDRQKRPIDFRGDRGTRRSPGQPKKHQPIYLSRR
jgi:hypothetical protein